ncbi:hypothetical protein MPAR168_21000 [Methylorubrum populi]|uniref:Uncharacterized protein n=1 Tax=Methylobacterium radiotolerans TaxID=31998 RepID=A0ABU7T593_9HYPH|nr:hypothetical protein [Methylobacterium sp. B4]PXW55562.1 hypothetical protein BY998_11846 [Methylobacterium sp. B4]
MTDNDRSRPSLKTFDAYADRNGQDLGSDSPLDVGLPSRTQADLKSNPDGLSEAARLASGTPRQDAVEQTEAETPEENLRRISDPSTTPVKPDAKAEEAIERATAAVGQEEAPRHGK